MYTLSEINIQAEAFTEVKCSHHTPCCLSSGDKTKSDRKSSSETQTNARLGWIKDDQQKEDSKTDSLYATSHKHGLYLCQVSGCCGWRWSWGLFPFTSGAGGATVEAFRSGEPHVAGTWLCRHEGLPAGKGHYSVSCFHILLALVWMDLFLFV